MKKDGHQIILGIESSCDDTAAAVCVDGKVVSNVVVTQEVHAQYGGVVPELASRAHLANIVPGIKSAVSQAGISLTDVSAIAVTQGPGLLGSLGVGACAAKGLAAALDVPLIGVNHMDAHIMSCFIEPPLPTFPFLCLTISGGHSQLTVVRAVDDMEVIGRTRDDAAGEAFDKIGKLIGLPYPAGPHIDRLAELGEPKFHFTRSDMSGYDFTFSGLKTQVMYFVRDEMKKNDSFVEDQKNDIAASVREAIVDMLMAKLSSAATDTGIKQIAIAGGVSANALVRRRMSELALENNWQVHIPSIAYCTDNAAMIAVTGYYKYLAGQTTNLSMTPFARFGK